MLNLLIITDDIDSSLQLLNYISNNTNKIKVHSIVYKIEDGLSILNGGKIDLVYIKSNQSISSILKTIHNISKLYTEKYKKSFLIVNDQAINYSNDSYIFNCLASSQNVSKVFEELEKMATEKLLKLNNSVILKKIKKELQYLKYDFSHNGTQYLIDSIMIVYQNINDSENLNKNVYPILSKKYNKSINNIKVNISNATNSMFYECDMNILKDYFNFYYDCKPKTKLVIFTILNKIS